MSKEAKASDEVEACGHIKAPDNVQVNVQVTDKVKASDGAQQSNRVQAFEEVQSSSTTLAQPTPAASVCDLTENGTVPVSWSQDSSCPATPLHARTTAVLPSPSLSPAKEGRQYGLRRLAFPSTRKLEEYGSPCPPREELVTDCVGRAGDALGTYKSGALPQAFTALTATITDSKSLARSISALEHTQPSGWR